MALTRPAGSNQSNLYGRSQWLSGFYSPVDQHTLNEAYAIAYAVYRESDPKVRKILEEQILDSLDSLVADDEQRGHSNAWRRRPPRGVLRRLATLVLTAVLLTVVATIVSRIH
jgi:hypothetical protein